MVRERLESREREIHGEWLTEEKMVKSQEFSAMLCCSLSVAAATCSVQRFALAEGFHPIDDSVLRAVSTDVGQAACSSCVGSVPFGTCMSVCVSCAHLTSICC